MKSLFTIVMLTISSATFAGQLAGQYHLNKSCNVITNIGTVFLPKGPVSIAENIPVRGNLNDRYNAVMVQVGENSDVVLTLGIGEVSPFRFGPQVILSKGTYSNDKSKFTEVLNDPTGNTDQSLAEVVLTKSTGGLMITSKDLSGSATMISCALTLSH